MLKRCHPFRYKSIYSGAGPDNHAPEFQVLICSPEVDLNKTISELRAQRDEIDVVIRQLEAMKDGAGETLRSTGASS